MSYKIILTYQGGRQNHIANPLNCLDGREYTTREEACEAIYERMYDVINSETGCEMVDKSKYGVSNMYDDNNNFMPEMLDEYENDCHIYITEYGYATEDGVTATVEESDED